MLRSSNVDLNNMVLVFFMDEKTGITLRLTPEEAIQIGQVGEMARIRKEYEDESMEEDNGSN